MSSYKGHLFGGMLFFIPLAVVLVLFFDYQKLTKLEFLLQAGILFSITLLFALWPDVDIKSKGQLLFYRMFLALDVVLIVTQKIHEAAFLGLFAMLPLIGRHRGWTHSLWAAFLIPTPFLFLPLFYAGKPLNIGLPYYLAAVFGYLSHRFMDGMMWKRKK